MKHLTPTGTQDRRCGYTLVELIVSTGLLGLVMVSMVGTFMVFASSSKGVAAYTEMSQQSRSAGAVRARHTIR
jgi:type II secretory pathway pseudopilin PulG